jgi:hypothetical protein
VDTLAPDIGAQVTLLGFGCRRIGGGGPSGLLYQGISTVRREANDQPFVETRGRAAVCSGDSGGGAYIRPAPSAPRRLFGVNSRGDLITRSQLTAIAFPSVRRFIEEWKDANQVEICGIDELAQCR